MTGRTLGNYQILEQLGSGGMGEVFKARDSRLNRYVAIKVLHADLTVSASRKQRFIQEAQSASALNHPNIVTIYDIFQHEGIDCLVMEYIDGKTLDAVIPRHGLRLNEALRIAIQAAEGLRKAHSAGIIHRDVKPSNIMVPTDGPVKILDFGLAKLTESTEASDDDTTRTGGLAETEEGTVLGTVAYMSPEQAEGRKIDTRTDIFSFGAVLYEMLSGNRAFARDSKLSVMSAILKDEPKPVENLPAELERILRRCLRKDADKRYQHMGDLKLALEELKEESESGRLDKAAPPAPLKTGKFYLAAALATLTTAGLFLWWRNHESVPVTEGYTFRQITSDTGLTTTPAISPDGKLIAYSSDRRSEGNLDIWVQPLTADARPIRLTTHSADDLAPSFSPDGGTIAFYSRREGGGIYLIPALGGEERLLVKNNIGYDAKPRFSPDGKWIAYASGLYLSDSHIMIVPTSGGVAKALGPNLSWAIDPAWSPEGKHIAAAGRNSMDGKQHYWVLPTDGSPAMDTGTATITAPFSATQLNGWFPGFLLYTSARAAWALPIEQNSWKTGPPRKLAESTAGLMHAQALATGKGVPERIVFDGLQTAVRLWSLPLDSNSGKVRGDLKPLPQAGGSQLTPDLTADGRLLAYVQDDAGRQELRLRDLHTNKERQLVSSFARPKFSPDGSKIAYRTSSALSVTDLASSEVVKLLDQSGNSSNIYGWHAKGITYWHGSPIRFSLLNPVTGQLQELLSHSTLALHGAELSPDAKWLAFHIPGPANEPLYITPVRDGKAAGQSEWIQISETKGLNRRPWWSQDGKLLYWISERESTLGIWAQKLSPDKRPTGQAFNILRFPETRRTPNRLGLAQFGPGVAANQIVFAMQELSGNIWLAERNQ